MPPSTETEQFILAPPDDAAEFTPESLFLPVYNRQLARHVPSMEDWYVFGGFIDDLHDATDRTIGIRLLERMVIASTTNDSDRFDVLCRSVEACALPGWRRRMSFAEARRFDDLHPDQIGARLAGLAALAEAIGWDVGGDIAATGFGARTTTWHFPALAGGPGTAITIRAGRPCIGEIEPVDIDFAIADGDAPGAVARRVINRLIDLTQQASQSGGLVDFAVRRRLEQMRLGRAG